MHALAPQGVEIGGERGDQRLAFAGLHLGDGAAVQHYAADQLHVEVAHLQVAPAGFPDDRERLRQQVVERFAAVDPRAEFVGLGAQLVVRERLDLRLVRIDIDDARLQPFQQALILGTKGFGQEFLEHHVWNCGCVGAGRGWPALPLYGPGVGVLAAGDTVCEAVSAGILRFYGRDEIPSRCGSGRRLREHCRAHATGC